jgi:hypothetical protein
MKRKERRSNNNKNITTGETSVGNIFPQERTFSLRGNCQNLNNIKHLDKNDKTRVCRNLQSYIP